VGHLWLIFVVWFRRLQILVNDKEKSFIIAYHVLDGIDCCCVDLLKSRLTKFSGLYEGLPAQVSGMWPGSSVAVIISCLPEEMINQMIINSIDYSESIES